MNTHEMMPFSGTCIFITPVYNLFITPWALNWRLSVYFVKAISTPAYMFSSVFVLLSDKIHNNHDKHK